MLFRSATSQDNSFKYNGYLDEIRLTHAARYTSNFSPPEAPFSTCAPTPTPTPTPTSTPTPTPTATATPTPTPVVYADGYYLGCPSFTFSGLTSWLSDFNGTYRAWGTMTNGSWSQNNNPVRYLKVDNSNNIIPGIELKFDNAYGGLWYFYDGVIYVLFNYNVNSPSSVPTSGWLQYCGQVDPSCDPPAGLTVTQNIPCSGYILDYEFP